LLLLCIAFELYFEKCLLLSFRVKFRARFPLCITITNVTSSEVPQHKRIRSALCVPLFQTSIGFFNNAVYHIYRQMPQFTIITLTPEHNMTNRRFSCHAANEEVYRELVITLSQLNLFTFAVVTVNKAEYLRRVRLEQLEL
jgi:hypothetical protein